MDLEQADTSEMEDSDTSRTVVPADDPDNQWSPTPVSEPPGQPFLWSPLAKGVSLGTGLTRGGLRAIRLASTYPFNITKATTLKTIEVGRYATETLLSIAGKDAYTHAQTDLARDETVSAVAGLFGAAHTGFTYLQLLVAMGFDSVGSSISWMMNLCDLGLLITDGLLGSTESSRAFRSIMTFLSREFQNPATGIKGERVSKTDLIKASFGLAYLQKAARKLDEAEYRRLRFEESIWDVVVVDGKRVDIYEDGLYGVHKGTYKKVSDVPDACGKTLNTIEHPGPDSSDDELLEIRLKRQIIDAVPPGVRFTVYTSTTKTIAVDISCSQPPHITPPPGVEFVELGRLSGNPSAQNLAAHQFVGEETADATPAYRMVFRINREEVRGNSSLLHQTLQGPRFIEQVDDASDNEATPIAKTSKYNNHVEEAPPQVPPKTILFEPESLRGGGDPPTAQRSTVADEVQDQPLSPKSRQPVPIPRKPNDQKRVRSPPFSPPSSNSVDRFRDRRALDKIGPKGAKTGTPPPSSKITEKKGGFRSAFKKGAGPALSSLLRKDGSEYSLVSGKGKQPGQPASDTAATFGKSPPGKSAASDSHLPAPTRFSSMILKRDPPRPPQRVRTPLTSRALHNYDQAEEVPMRSSQTTQNPNDRHSFISIMDSLSIRTINSRPESPMALRGDGRKRLSFNRSLSEKDIAGQYPPASPKSYRQMQSHGHAPSIYTLKTNDSQTSLILSPYRSRSAYDENALDRLRRTGVVDGMFPKASIFHNISRYMRFSSASYGSQFLKALGIARFIPQPMDDTHHEVASYAHHTGIDNEDVLLASFIDNEGGTDSSGSTNSSVPLVHYISIDKESKAVVLACRGTLGFEDILADMACDYDYLYWRGKAYKVHKGIHASARRLLYGGDGRVLTTLRDALEKNPDCGLVLCGHSLGGGVTALLGIMLSEPHAPGPAFVTSTQRHRRLLGDGRKDMSIPTHIDLPAGRPIHVFAYGPPGTMSPSLRKVTRGLITTIVHGQDLVPHLSLGVLHDFQAVALALRSTNSENQELWQRVKQEGQAWIGQKLKGVGPVLEGGDDAWAYAALKALRANMLSQKLLPPGEVLLIESSNVLQRPAFVQGQEFTVKPAKRIVLKHVRDVEARFREIRCSSVGALFDHHPGRYEEALNNLKFGVQMV